MEHRAFISILVTNNYYQLIINFYFGFIQYVQVILASVYNVICMTSYRTGICYVEKVCSGDSFAFCLQLRIRDYIALLGLIHMFILRFYLGSNAGNSIMEVKLFLVSFVSVRWLKTCFLLISLDLENGCIGLYLIPRQLILALHFH